MKPVRSVPLGRRSVTGRLARGKNGSSVAFESTLERDFFLILEFDPTVLDYWEQPVRIEYEARGRIRTYTPDVFVRHLRDAIPGINLRPWLCEVKPLAVLRAEKAALEPKFRAAEEFARKRGWEFRVFTEREIRGPYLENAKFLLPYRNAPPDTAHVRLLLELVLDVEETDPEELLRRVTSDKWERATVVPALWHLVATKRIGTDLTLPLTMRSRIWRMAWYPSLQT